MNIAVILAGGTGQRFGSDTPKQFTPFYNKPIIVYALEIYESSPHIDAIEVPQDSHYKRIRQRRQNDYSHKYGNMPGTARQKSSFDRCGYPCVARSPLS